MNALNGRIEWTEIRVSELEGIIIEMILYEQQR